jgi:carbonic anhydrase/acetyltransferase-like protein (isoleucine patch superfamily)
LGRLAVQQYSNQNIINTTTTNYSFIIGEDLSLNNRLFINGDASMNNRLFVSGDLSLNSRLFVLGDSSLNGNVYIVKNTTINGDVSMNNRLFIGGDLSLNSRLFISGDMSINSRISVGSDVSINGNLYVNNYFKINRITENINTLTYQSTIPVTFTNNSTLYYLVNPTANFTINFATIPTDPNQTFVCTLLINTGISNRFYCNAVQIGGTGKTLLCNGGIANVALGTCTFVTQSFVFVNAGGTSPVAVLTNVVPYQ